MRPLVVAAALSAACLCATGWAAAPPMQIVNPVISQMDGGSPEPAGFEFVPGQTFFFSCRVTNYGRSPENRVELSYTVQPFDAQDVPLAELYKNKIADEVTPQDKDWQPKISTGIAIPPQISSGTYKVVVKVEDGMAKTTAELSVPFQVRAREVPASETLVVRNFRFFRNENDPQALPKAAYRSGDGLWVRFDITGFRYGASNAIDISYQASILGASGKVLWTQPEAATEQTQSFYPKRWVEGIMGLSLQGTKPGQYTLVMSAKDAIGNQTCEARTVFTVE